MKKTFKILSVLLLVLMLVFTLTSCKEKEENKPVDNQPVTEKSCEEDPSQEKCQPVTNEPTKADLLAALREKPENVTVENDQGIIKFNLKFEGEDISELVFEVISYMDNIVIKHQVGFYKEELALLFNIDEEGGFKINQNVDIDSLYDMIDDVFFGQKILENVKTDDFVYNKGEGCFEYVEKESGYKLTIKLSDKHLSKLCAYDDKGKLVESISFKNYGKTKINVPDYESVLSNLSAELYYEYINNYFAYINKNPNYTINEVIYDSNSSILLSDLVKVDLLNNRVYDNIYGEEKIYFENGGLIAEYSSDDDQITYYSFDKLNSSLEFSKTVIDMIKQISFSELYIDSYDYKTRSLIVRTGAITLDGTHFEFFKLEITNGLVTKIVCKVDDESTDINGSTVEAKVSNYGKTTVELPSIDLSDFEFSADLKKELAESILNVDVAFAQTYNGVVSSDDTIIKFRNNSNKYYIYSNASSVDAEYGIYEVEKEVLTTFYYRLGKFVSSKVKEKPDYINLYTDLNKFVKQINDLTYDENDKSFCLIGDSTDRLYFENGMLCKVVNETNEADNVIITELTITYTTEPFVLPDEVADKIAEITQ